MSILRFLKSFLLASISIFISISIKCQEYNYAHYDVKDGLAGSTVYSEVQDHDGFMWFGTETGLSRFDGTHFKNFYTGDGPDNENIKLFIDSKNRVWIIPFKNSICYYWKGKIHNQENDSLLRQLKISHELVSVIEDRHGNILIAEQHRLYLISPSWKITAINNFQGLSFSVMKTGIDISGRFEIATTLTSHGFFLATVNEQKLVLNRDITSFGGNSYSSLYLKPGLEIMQKENWLYFSYEDSRNDFKLALPDGFISMSEINDTSISFNTIHGALFFNTQSKKITDTFLRHQTINAVTEDNEGSFWFSLLGKGIYRLASGRFLNFSALLQNRSVFSIQKQGSVLYAGSDNFNLFLLNTKNNTVRLRKISKGITRGRIISLIVRDKNIIVGTDNGLFRFENFVMKDSLKDFAVKSAFLNSGNKVIISASQGVYDVSLDNFLRQDTIWEERSTCAYKKAGFFYIGTLNGLYSVDTIKKITYLGNADKIFQNRINSISESKDGALLVATNGSGIAIYKGNKVIFNITERDGLTSNICRNIFVVPDGLWVGTDKGLNKIIFSDTAYHIKTFTQVDGLSSDIINAIYADGNDIYVGTPEGIDFFDETRISKKSICNLRITSLIVGRNSMQADTTAFTLQHSDNNIEVSFIGISYKSAGNISYQYRLLGSDTAWQTTNQTSLNYPSLSSGKYELQLKAVNKFGVQSNLVKFKFTISKRLQEKTWFRLLFIASLIALIWLLMSYWIKIIKRRENEKSETLRKISELEQMALKSQMNPHFIFNCLNSIQHYVIDKDIIGVNDFISKFSRLIRLTLDNSSKTDISLAEETDYIKTYLELEQKRFEGKFSFEIIQEGINYNDYFIPPMILQPFVENAVRHGVRYRNDGQGKIIVKINKEVEYLICSIRDNGIGRKLSWENKSKNPVEYQSKGMELTSRRIAMFNMAHASKISIRINDLEGENQKPVGTEVVVWFPLKEVRKFNNVI